MLKINKEELQKEFTPMDIRPGNVVAKINAIRLEGPKYNTNTKEVNFYLELETKPVSNGFEGYMINKDKPELGKYKGQVKTITNSRWTIKDFETKAGKQVSLDEQCLKFLYSLLKELKSDWLDNKNDVFKTIEEAVIAFNKEKPFKDIYLEWCLGGREKINAKGYANYYMFIPDYKVCPVGFAAIGGDKKVTKYDKDLHLIKDTSSSVESEELNSKVVVVDDNDSPFLENNDEELFNFDEE